MYMEECICVIKNDDDTYTLQVKVKRKKEKTSRNEISYPGAETKTLTAQTIEEVCAKIEMILPGVHKGYMEEEEFDAAFKEAPEG